MWATNFLTVGVVYKIVYELFQLTLCYQVPIFHNHIIMWVLPFCQIGLVDNLSKEWILPSFKTSYIAFVPLL
jgi:hypothetical protein